MIVKFWYGVQGDVISVVQYPRHCYKFKGV